jgi:hypothetical protein
MDGTKPMHPSLLRAFQRDQEHNLKHQMMSSHQCSFSQQIFSIFQQKNWEKKKLDVNLTNFALFFC